MKILGDWETLAKRQRFIAFDTETTGLDPRQEELLEIGAVLVSQRAIIAGLSLMIRPSKPIPVEAFAVHGISDAMVAHALPVSEALSVFERFIGDYPLVGHHTEFDLSFIQAGHGCRLSNEVFCTAMMARRLLPLQQSYSLRSLCQRFGIINKEAHRALSDANATALVALALLGYGVNPEPLRFFVVTEKDTYAIKDTLKSFGFKWNAGLKIWWIAVPETKISAAMSPDGDQGSRIFGILCRETNSSPNVEASGD